jgi:DNA-binding transcriptional LysR family regulator
MRVGYRSRRWRTEERLGFKRFARDHVRLTPTAEARALLPEVMKAISASILSNAIRRFGDERPNVLDGFALMGHGRGPRRKVVRS